MSVKAGSFTPNGLGNSTVDNLTFLPSKIKFRMGPQTNATDTVVTARCDGWATANNQSYDSWFRDSTGSKQKAGIDKCILHYKRVSGVIEERVAANFVNFHENTPTNFGFTINMTAFDATYQIRYIASN